MSLESSCRCLICGMERSLILQLAEPRQREHYQEFAESHGLLSTFPSAADLVAHLHNCRNTNIGIQSADVILAELMQATAMEVDAAPLRDLLLLVFAPALHSTLRRVNTRYPSLSADDIAQHAVASLLETFRSAEFLSRTSHVAFSIARILRRNTFKWAEREWRSPVHRAVLDEPPESTSKHSTEAIEHTAFLHHFLHRCHERGLLSTEDLNLLVHFKLDVTYPRKLEEPARVYSNASRQRMKRLLGKLRRLARDSPMKGSPLQLRLF